MYFWLYVTLFSNKYAKKNQKKQKQNKKKLRLTLKKNIAEENMSQVIRLKNIDKAKKYFVEET